MQRVNHKALSLIKLEVVESTKLESCLDASVSKFVQSPSLPEVKTCTLIGILIHELYNLFNIRGFPPMSEATVIETIQAK